MARYEFKYLVDDALMSEIRDRASMWMERDSYGDGKYRVTSLYLDRGDWLLARQTWEGLRERFKLRIRYYDHAADVLFAEVKLRTGNSISKIREVVALEVAAALASGGQPPEDAAERFRQLAEKIDAQPRLWVRYNREAWVSPWGDNSRLTFDTDLEVQSADGVARPIPEEWRSVDLEQPVIVEMKFNEAYPRWMRQITEGLEMRRTSCSKYAQGVELLADNPWAIGNV